MNAVPESGGATIRVYVRNDGAKAGPSTVKLECEPFTVTMIQGVPGKVNPTTAYQPAPGMAGACFPAKTMDVPALDTGKTHMALLGFTKCGAQYFRCQVTATVDAGQQVKELNESNNIMKQILPHP